MYAGCGEWVPTDLYDSLCMGRTRPTIFIKRIASCIITDAILKKSSVTGKLSNAHNSKTQVKPALDQLQLQAVFGIVILLRYGRSSTPST